MSGFYSGFRSITTHSPSDSAGHTPGRIEQSVRHAYSMAAHLRRSWGVLRLGEVAARMCGHDVGTFSGAEPGKQYTLGDGVSAESVRMEHFPMAAAVSSSPYAHARPTVNQSAVEYPSPGRFGIRAYRTQNHATTCCCPQCLIPLPLPAII